MHIGVVRQVLEHLLPDLAEALLPDRGRIYAAD